MIIFYFNNNQNEHSRIIKHLFNSYKGIKALQPTSKFGANARLNNNATAIVFAGMIRGEGLIYKWCIENSKRFFYIDHAYLERGYNSNDPNNEWMRVTDSGFVWNQIEDRPFDRWNKFFAKKYECSGWRKPSQSSNNILVLPPSYATQYLFPESRAWLDQTLNILQKSTHRPIIVREKPIQTELNAFNQVIRSIKYRHENSIEREMEQAHCIVTYNSAVPVLGSILGIPCHTSSNAAAFPISVKLTEVDNPELHEREKWLAQLVYHQYRTSEFISGEFWNMILENNPLGKK